MRLYHYLDPISRDASRRAIQTEGDSRGPSEVENLTEFDGFDGFDGGPGGPPKFDGI